VRRRRIVGLIAASLLVSACAAPETPQARQATTRRWITSTGLGGTIATLQRTTATAERLVADPAVNPNDRQTVCSVLLLGVQQANGDLPAPADHGLSVLLASAYSDLGAAATACGSSGFGAGQVAAFERSRRSGLEALSEASAKAEAVMGARLSTSTTFPSDPGSAS
jgi:hypothetical protein